MSEKLSLAEGTMYHLGKLVDLFINLVETTDICDPHKNPEYREYLIRECGMTEEEIEEGWPHAAEG